MARKQFGQAAFYFKFVHAGYKTKYISVAPFFAL